MLCPKCGAQVNEGIQNCPSCGQSLARPHVARRPMPLWFKIVTIIAVIALIGVTAGILFTERLVDVVDHQLQALRQNEIERAYEEYTSKEFQQETSLDKFRRFLQAYPIFLNSHSANFTERSVKDHVGTLKGHLIAADHTKVPVEYKVIKENGKWKILSIRLLQSSQTKIVPKTIDAKDLIAVVKAQLQAIEKGDLTKAYQDYSSQEFTEATSQEKFENFIKRYSIFSKHTSASFHKPTTRQGISIVPVILNSAHAAAYIKYYLVYEGGTWKIWSIRILAPAEESRKEDVESETAPLSLSGIKLGHVIDELGVIREPRPSFTKDAGDIYVNVDVNDGKEGQMINFNFQHIDSHTSIFAEASIEREGKSVVLASFSPPNGEWPQGIYQLAVMANALIETVDFEID